MRPVSRLYLNVVELGRGIYGAEAAARHYFGKAAAGLGEAEGVETARNPWGGRAAATG